MITILKQLKRQKMNESECSELFDLLLAYSGCKEEKERIF